MKNSIALILSILLFACTSEPTQLTDEPNKNPIVETLEQKIKHHIEASLQIPATEKYEYEKYEAHVNGDDSLDIIITVNRLGHALERAINSDRLAKRAETGFMGNYNFFFVMDGKTKEISPPILVPSSAKAKLQVRFENIRTEAYKDILIDFKLEHGAFRRFFTMYNGLPKEVFQIMLYDGLGDLENKAISIEYDQGSYSLAKDILIYVGKLEKVDFKDPSEVYSYDPKIENTKVLERRWFFNDNQRKYFTMKDK
ncbi:MAG TPA: hypothetical protein EYG86_00635 [Crocinitomicaceae bacterium]|nr:hypothetical protein [Crocinitomicaceae bacterium]